MFDSLPTVNIRILWAVTKSQKMGSNHCTICDISCGAFSPYALY